MNEIVYKSQQVLVSHGSSFSATIITNTEIPRLLHNLLCHQVRKEGKLLLIFAMLSSWSVSLVLFIALPENMVKEAIRVMRSGHVVLLFYVHGKHLRSCRDGQLT